MNTSRTCQSFNSVTDKDFRADHLKLCFLWYDEILIETIGNYDEKRFVERLLQAELLNELCPCFVRCNPSPSIGNYRNTLPGTGEVKQRGYPRWGKTTRTTRTRA